MKSKKTPKRAGFTLVELLVVIAIISILLTLGATALKGAGGQGTGTALAATEALFDEARSIAVGKGTRARVMVDVGDPEESNYLRRVVVAYEELDPDGQPVENSWVLAGRGYVLPENTYFSRDYSNGGSSGLQSEQMNFDGSAYDREYVYYEFNSEGICTSGVSGTSDYEAPSFVVAAGARAIGGEPRTTREAKRDFKGFVIWRNGATSVFRDPSQILDGAEPDEF